MDFENIFRENIKVVIGDFLEENLKTPSRPYFGFCRNVFREAIKVIIVDIFRNILRETIKVVFKDV